MNVNLIWTLPLFTNHRCLQFDTFAVKIPEWSLTGRQHVGVHERLKACKVIEYVSDQGQNITPFFCSLVFELLDSYSTQYLQHGSDQFLVENVTSWSTTKVTTYLLIYVYGDGELSDKGRDLYDYASDIAFVGIKIWYRYFACLWLQLLLVVAGYSLD